MLPDEPTPPPRPGPFYAVRCVRAYSAAAGTARGILTALATYADDDGVCYPSIPALVRDSGRGRSTVKRALHQLEADGEVVVECRGNGRGHSTRYRIAAVRPFLTVVDTAVDPVDNPPDKGVQNGTVPERKGSAMVDKGVHSGPRTTKELPRGEGEPYPDRCPVHRGTPDPPPCRGCQRVREANAYAATLARIEDRDRRRRDRLEADRAQVDADRAAGIPPPPAWRTR